MSGQKSCQTSTPRSTVTTARNNASNRQARTNTVQNAVSAATRGLSTRLNSIEQANRNRENRTNQRIQGLSGSLRRAEERRVADMAKQDRTFENRIRRTSQVLQANIVNERKQRRAELQQTKANLERQLSSAVGAERAERRRDIARVSNQINTVDRNLRREISNVDKNLRADMQNQKRELVNRMDHLVGEERAAREREVRRIDENIRQLDRAIDQVDAKLDSEIERVENNFREMIDIEAEQRRVQIENLRDWTATNLEQQRQEYLDIAAQHEREIMVNREAIQEINKKIETNTKAASEYIQELQKYVSEGYEDQKRDFEKYVPGRIQEVIRRSNRAVDELNSGAEQTAKGEAINAHEEWLKLNAEMEQKRREFEFWHSEALKEVLALFEIIKENRENGHHIHGDKIVETDGKQEEIYVDATIELDYWTNGEFSKLESEVEEHKRALETPDDLTLKDVENIRAQLNELRQREQAIIIDAEEKVIASQMRAEMGDIAVEALEAEGFTLVRSGYDKSDQRRGYLVNLKNRGGADVVVSFFPAEENNDSVLDVQIKNEVSYSEQETVAIVNSIIGILREEGIDTGTIQCEQSHLNEFYDFDKIFSKEGGLPQEEIKKKGGVTF